MEGYINICKVDGALSVMGGIYNDNDTAIKSGKCIKGYLVTVPITIPETQDNK